MSAYWRSSGGARERCAPKGAATAPGERAKATGAIVLLCCGARAKATGAVRVA